MAACKLFAKQMLVPQPVWNNLSDSVTNDFRNKIVFKNLLAAFRIVWNFAGTTTYKSYKNHFVDGT